MNTVSSISLNRFPQRGKKVRKKESSICSLMAEAKLTASVDCSYENSSAILPIQGSKQNPDILEQYALDHNLCISIQM